MKKDVGDVLRECYRRGWITTRDGNVSFRYKNDDVLYITPSGIRKHEIYEKDILELPIVDNKPQTHTITPSGELQLHWELQKAFKEKSRAVLHAHPTHSIAAMEAGYDLDQVTKKFPEISRYTKVGPNVKYYAPLSKELAEVTVKTLCLDEEGGAYFDIVGLEKHGVIAIGTSIWNAFEHLERLNHVCEILLLANARIVG